MKTHLTLFATSLGLAACFLVSIFITRSAPLILLSDLFFGALGTFFFIQQTSRQTRVLEGAAIGAAIGACGWLIATVVQISLLLLMGKPRIAFAVNSLVLVLKSLAGLTLLSGLSGTAMSLLLSRANKRLERTRRLSDL
jgi:hypothetical protein